MSVKWRLVAYLSAFVVIMLGMLWLLQTVFLDDCYELIQKRNIVRIADRLENYIDSDADTLSTFVQYGAQNKIYVRIIDADGQDLLDDSTDDGTLGTLSYYDMVELLAKANDNGGSAFETYTSGELKIPLPKHADGLTGTYANYDIEKLESILYVRLVQRGDGTTSAILITSEITPLDATIGTLRVQLILASAVLLVMAVGLGYLISKKISGPIVLVNREAKKLSKGEYAPPLAGGEYREITELNETLVEAGRELSKTETLRRELLANVSHDLRTPLTLISGYAEMMRDIPGENCSENAQIIVEEAGRLANLVNDLLDVSRYRDGEQKLEMARYCLTDNVRDILERYASLAGEGYDIAFESDRNVYVTADQKRMEQVIYNLVSNAVQYTRGGWVRVRQIVDGHTVRIEVEDRGEGIPQDALPLIWDRYYKVDKTHKRAVAGSGIGLSIVRNILELHAAKFGVRSKVGEGSVFWFELPEAAE